MNFGVSQRTAGLRAVLRFSQLMSKLQGNIDKTEIQSKNCFFFVLFFILFCKLVNQKKRS